ncbi:orotate phosphoribosyltransferase [Bacillus sp. FJAT-27916]|uniref:orotate phosphoribosyltransferase n=1 Tax=Bacillaceae TaxID=186817 RepID=UPI000670A9CA|nr:orotate phosphoribosyltransferase [Bacillus sp. FJAT-27916]KMY45062.1 orotate phosphoribosyltransferase [Bacillus sp. FJAT-27916]
MNKQTIAEHLLNIKAVSLKPNDPFTWSSGLKSPIYCDNRLTLSYPAVRKEIAQGLAELIQTKFPQAKVVAGTATAGIPHAAWVSEILNLPMVYVRSSAKGHGKGNQIEGIVKEGDKVVVVEDLISTGGSSITCVQALRDAGCHVEGVVSIFTYELEKATAAFKEADIPYFSLTDFTTLTDAAKEKQSISEDELESLRKWKANPAEWGK